MARRIVRIGGWWVIALVAVLFAGAGTLWVRGGRTIARTYDVPEHAPVAIPDDSASLARGEHIVRSWGTCTLCHGEDLGGAVYADEGAFGLIAGPNLTRGAGGVGGELSDDEWVRAIRYGVARDDRSLIVMPSEVFVHMSDRDLGAVIAYLKQLPAVDREVPRSRFGPVGRLFVGSGRLNLFSASKTAPLLSVPHVEPAVSAEYGRYLVEAGGCAGCHGYGLSGGRVAGPPGLPLASNLTPAGGVPSWSEDDFFRAMREGVRPGGARLDEFMPWRSYAHMTDDELRAIRRYLAIVPAKAFGHK